MNRIYPLILALIIGAGAYAQKSDGSLKSLLATEKAFVQKLAKDGENAAYIQFAAEDGIVFRPNPINAKKHFSTAADAEGIKRGPNFARLSKSRDWAITSGLYTRAETKEKIAYKHYLSVWKAIDGEWKYIIDIDAETNRPIKGREPKESFVEPKETYTPRFTSKNDLKAATDIIYSTEKTLNTLLKTHGIGAFSGFLNHDARLLFPGTDVLLGKGDILAFNNRMIDKINLKTTQADRALGGDFAYTYGVATIDYKTDLRESFHYLFIWERQKDGNWNIVAQIFAVAER